MTRPVTTFKHEYNNDTKKYDKVPEHKGQFHQFGLDMLETDEGVASYSVALVELPDGTIVNPPAEMIKFEDGPLGTKETMADQMEIFLAKQEPDFCDGPEFDGFDERCGEEETHS